MAKSIRLKTETQKRVSREVDDIYERTRLTVSDAVVVDMLVNEALDAREAAAKRKTRGGGAA